jgi:hypothetical protein
MQTEPDSGGTMKASDVIEKPSGEEKAPVHRLTPRRHYPTIRLKPFRRGPLSRLAWIFGLSR